ncbi:MAG: RnfABCDGE type electron transport complex subunit G [Victivallaceae bacterium]|nr:RnfABCDGE type electron transport complex subunit G [Victivallaceae bacterium]
MMNLKNTENYWALGAFLGLTGLAAALLLAAISQLVAGPIKNAERASTNRALIDILPAFDNQPGENTLEREYNGTAIKFMGAQKDGKLVAVAAQSSAKGYGGPVTVLVGLDPNGGIRAVLVTGQNETPGLGASVCARKFQKTITNFWKPVPGGLAPNRFLDQFAGKTPVAGRDWKIIKNGGTVEYVTGSTVTSNAITAAVNAACQCYLADRAAIESGLAGGSAK